MEVRSYFAKKQAFNALKHIIHLFIKRKVDWHRQQLCQVEQLDPIVIIRPPPTSFEIIQS